MWKAGLLLLLAGWPLLAKPAEEATELRLRFYHGQQLAYRMRVEQTAELVLDGATGEARRTHTVTEAELLLRALEVEESGCRLEITFSDLRAVQELEGRRLPLPAAVELRRARLSLRISSRGEVSEVQVVNSGELAEPVRRVAESWSRLLEHMTLPLPQAPLQPTATWPLQRRLQLPLDGTPGVALEVAGQAQFARLQECRRQRCARLEAELSLKMAGAGAARGVPLQSDLSGRGRAWVLLALDSGRLLKSGSQTEIAGLLQAGEEGSTVSTRVRLQSSAQLELVR